MKILFLIRDLEAGGAERQLVVLANGLAAKGHAVTVGVFCGGGQFEQAIDRSKVELVDLAKRGSIPHPSFLLRLVGLIRRLRPDVVHTYARSANTWGALAMLAAPGKLVWGFRNTRFHIRELYSNLADYCSVPLRARVSMLLTNSTGAREALIGAGYRSEKVHTIPNGIDLDAFRRDTEAGKALRACWGIADGDILVGLVGTARPEKDPGDFFLAARLARETEPRLRFACVGYLSEARVSQLKTIAADAGIDPETVAWAPSRGRLHEVYSALDVLCLSSRSGEGFPNVVGEAMACEVPCVVTDVGDAAMIVGDLGWVAPPANIARLADGLVNAAQLDREHAPELRRRIAENFSVERLVDRTESVLLSLLPETSLPEPPAHTTPRATEMLR